MAKKERPESEFLTGVEARHLLGLGSTTFYRRLERKQIPAPVMLPGATCPRWRRADLVAFIESQQPVGQGQ